MTQPSLLVGAIVTRLTTLLGTSAVDVRQYDGDLDADALGNVTVNAPAVLVACSSMPRAPSDYFPPTVEGNFVALCIARVSRATAKSRGDVSMDLASLVQYYVDGNEMWAGLATRRGSGSRAINMTNSRTLAKGLAIWAVTWRQYFEITPADVEAIGEALAKITYLLPMGGIATPDEESETVFP